MPMDLSRYPSNWADIALSVKRAAGWCCEDCGRPCRRPGQRWLDFAQEIWESGWQDDLDSPSRFVLTTAHLDQDPGNNDRNNLRALCSVCHLNYDRQFQVFNHMAKLERNTGQLNLFDLRPPEPAGKGRRLDRIQIPLRQEVGL